MPQLLYVPTYYIVTGSVHRWYANLTGVTIGGAIVNMTGWTVQAYFQDPNGVQYGPFPSVAPDAAHGFFYYDNLATLFAIPGQWSVWWAFNNGVGFVDIGKPFYFFANLPTTVTPNWVKPS